MKKKIKIRRKPLIATLAVIGLAAIITPTLASCAGPIEGLNAQNIINLVFPNLWVFIGQIISMIILFSAIVFLVWKPTNKMIQRRKDLILGEIEQAKKDKELAALELENAKKINLEAAQKAHEIIAQANNESIQIRDEANKQAQLNAASMIDQANIEISREYKKAQDSLNQEIIDVALKTAESLIQRKIDINDDKKSIEQFIEGLKTDRV